MRFLIAPDSFKGSLTAMQVCTTIERAITEVWPTASTILMPMADGGEGTVDAVINAVDGQYVETEVTGPLGNKVLTTWGLTTQSEPTAIIEVANICGLPMVATQERNPLHTTSYGVGEVMLEALDQGIRSFVIGLGGSATNDGGIGLLTALGVRFYNKNNEQLTGYGRDLEQIAAIDYSKLDNRIKECRIVAASDVENPLLGPSGATAVFAPQKGATPEIVHMMEQHMQHYAQLINDHLMQTYHELPGGGAAGGIGFALLTIGATIAPGAQVVAETMKLDEQLPHVDWVITGEGMSDHQTLFGKLPFYIATRAKQYDKQCLLISGSLGTNAEALAEHFAGYFATILRPTDLATCLQEAEQNLLQVSKQIMQLMKNMHTSK